MKYCGSYFTSALLWKVTRNRIEGRPVHIEEETVGERPY